MKSKNKLEGASNFRAWKTRIDLILAKNKVLDIVKGKIVEPQFEEGKKKEPQNIAVLEKFKDNDINAMSIIVDSIKDHLIPYISHLDSSKKMYDARLLGGSGKRRFSKISGSGSVFYIIHKKKNIYIYIYIFIKHAKC
jgi:hypothetical protein